MSERWITPEIEPVRDWLAKHGFRLVDFVGPDILFFGDFLETWRLERRLFKLQMERGRLHPGIEIRSGRRLWAMSMVALASERPVAYPSFVSPEEKRWIVELLRRFRSQVNRSGGPRVNPLPHVLSRFRKWIVSRGFRTTEGGMRHPGPSVSFLEVLVNNGVAVAFWRIEDQISGLVAPVGMVDSVGWGFRDWAMILKGDFSPGLESGYSTISLIKKNWAKVMKACSGPKWRETALKLKTAAEGLREIESLLVMRPIGFGPNPRNNPKFLNACASRSIRFRFRDPMAGWHTRNEALESWESFLLNRGWRRFRRRSFEYWECHDRPGLSFALREKR